MSLFCRCALLCGLFFSTVAAQERERPADSARVPQLDTVVVTPQRSGTSIRTSSVAVSVIPSSLFRMLPLRSVGSALAVAPGIAVVDVSTLGGNPRVIVRGFYGGGETDYLAAQIDGVPIAALGSGAVNWEMLPTGAMDRVELVRGASSHLHGDAAVGGTLNAIVGVPPATLSWRVSGGGYGLLDGAVESYHKFDSGVADFAVDHRSSDGYRQHENRAATTLQSKIKRYTDRSSVDFIFSLHRRSFDDPGPLPSTIQDQRSANPFFRFDHTGEQVGRAGASGMLLIGGAKASGYLVGEYSTADAVKTLPLSPDFADTKLRRTTAPRALFSSQVELGDDDVRDIGRIVAGIDASAGRFSSRYADIVTGTADDYAASSGQAGPLGPSAAATRSALAGFLHWQIRPFSPLRISLGARLDHLHDSFDPSSSTGSAANATHNAASPRLAANFTFPATNRTTTNAYVSFGRAFKAPTLDQLFDERAIPIPVEPFSATVSNPTLVPQRGNAVEGGLYQSWTLGGGSRLDLSAAAYQQKMRDELDFDVTTFRYVNIGRSLHRGLELGANWTAASDWFAFASFTRQQVLAAAGTFDGNQLKAIPRQIVSGGVNAALWRGITASVLATSLGGAYVDDQNTTPLEGYTRFDSRVRIPIGPARVMVDVMNALNTSYDATAFPDPAGTPVVYHYPAAGRVFLIGLESK